MINISVWCVRVNSCTMHVLLYQSLMWSIRHDSSISLSVRASPYIAQSNKMVHDGCETLDNVISRQECNSCAFSKGWDGGGGGGAKNVNPRENPVVECEKNISRGHATFSTFSTLRSGQKQKRPASNACALRFPTGRERRARNNGLCSLEPISP